MKFELRQTGTEEGREEFDVPEDFSILNLKINLELAGVLYSYAWRNITEGEKKYNKLQTEIIKYEKSYQTLSKKHSAESEEFTVPLFKKIRELEFYYEPVVKHFSTAKILLICCAETYINEVMATRLNGKNLDEFDRLSLSGKWIFSQELLNFEKKIPVNSNPFQDFAQLIKERNKLVHFKGVPKSLKLLEIPNYLEDLKLTPRDCQKNFNAVKGMIEQFSLNWIGSYGPHWLDITGEYFREPCFYIGTREASMVLVSEKFDKLP